MTILVAGLLLFLGVHTTGLVAPDWRRRQIAQRGLPTWKGGYALLAGIGLALVVVGYGMARREPVVLYTPPAALRHLALLLMLPVFPLLLATYLPGRIRTATRHPTLLAVKLWALAHLLANGGLADLLLFGSFLAWAVAERVVLKRRSGAAAEHAAPTAAPRAGNDALALVGGLALYAVFLLWGHRWLIGVAPLG